jgi:hypothetical protein
MKKNYTHITLLLDRSGSMDGIWSDTIGSIKKFIEKQREVKGSATFSLTAFNSASQSVIKAEDIQKVDLSFLNSLCPSGMTALLDAQAREIDATGEFLKGLPEALRPEKVVFVVVTDGEENSSDEYRGQEGLNKLAEKVKHQTDVYRWQFVFLGANIDSYKVGGSVGYSSCNTANYTASAAGIRCAIDGLSDTLVSYRCGTQNDMSFTDATKKKIESTS